MGERFNSTRWARIIRFRNSSDPPAASMRRNPVAVDIIFILPPCEMSSSPFIIMLITVAPVQISG